MLISLNSSNAVLYPSYHIFNKCTLWCEKKKYYHMIAAKQFYFFSQIPEFSQFPRKVTGHIVTIIEELAY